MDRIKETFDAADSTAIFCDIMTVGVIIKKLSSSSVNLSSSSESSLATSLALSITSVWACSSVHKDASWLVVSSVCVQKITSNQNIWT
jgi:hypothetical protein